MKSNESIERGTFMPMRARVVLAVSVTAMMGACAPVEPPGGSYYEERIEPFFSNSCVRQNGPCHVTNERGVAMGNLDVTSFDALMRRRDALEAYGPYPVSLVLLKSGEQREISVFSMPFDGPRDADPMPVAIRTDVQHAGGRILGLSSESYNLLSQWSRQGHTRTGAPPTTLSENLGECNSRVWHAPGFVPGTVNTSSPHYVVFREQVQPMLVRRCAGSSCHGNTVADLFLSCGDSAEQLEWNYWAAMEFVAPGSTRSTSEILRRPLGVQVGGSFHEGGDVFGSTEDPDYVTLASWVESAPEEAYPEPFPAEIAADGHGSERGFRYFVERVQPTLVRSGCTFQNCHGTAMFHDLRLRGGSNGVFGHLATVRNYLMAREMLAVDSTDPNESRLIAKNLFPPTQEVGGEGIPHRGGALFESFPPDIASRRPNFATPDDCAMVDADAGDLTISREADGFVHPYCVMVRWHQIEREEAVAAGQVEADSLRGIVYVERPSGATGGGGRPDDFDTFRPGARLVLRDLGIDAMGELTALGGETDLSAGCGLGGTADIRGPAVTWDGTRVGFAARSSATRGYRLYELRGGLGPAADARRRVGHPRPRLRSRVLGRWSSRVRLDARLPHRRSRRRRRPDAHACAPRAEREPLRARGCGPAPAHLPAQPGDPALVHDRRSPHHDGREARDGLPPARGPSAEPRWWRLPPALRSTHQRGLRLGHRDRRGDGSQLRDGRGGDRSEQRRGRWCRPNPDPQPFDRPRSVDAARSRRSRLHPLTHAARDGRRVPLAGTASERRDRRVLCGLGAGHELGSLRDRSA
jgi:hypothetical protein